MTGPNDQPYGSPAPGAAGGWGSDEYGAPPAQAKRNGLGIAALVVGILAIIGILTVWGGLILGVIAVVLGVLGRGRAKRGEADNGGMALAGIILGAVAVAISGLLLAVGVAFLNSDSGKSLQQCVNDAQNDQAKVQQCQRDFADQLSN